MPPQKAQSDPSKSRSELSGRTQVVSTIVDNMVAHTGVIFSAQKTPQPVQLSTPAPQRVPVVFDPKISKGSLQRKTLATRLSQPIFAPGVFAIVADPKRQSRRDARLSDYTSSSTLTSFADDVVTLLNMAGLLQKTVSVRYPRDLGMRDLDHENYIFIGSPASNPSRKRVCSRQQREMLCEL